MYIWQISHVPKFGNWENDDVPYTAYFENARREKPGDGGVRINPNDPEENPEAFMGAMTRVRRTPLESEAPDHHHHQYHNSYDAAAVPFHQQHDRHTPPPRRVMSVGKRHGGADDLTGKSRHTRHHRNGSGGTQQSGESITSESVGGSTTDKSSSDYSVLRRHVVADRRKTTTISSSSVQGISDRGSISAATSDKVHRSHTSSGSNNNNNQYCSDHHGQHHHRAASIPKFGAWDVNDPKSGEGFTFIFDKLKEEKQINATGKVPNMASPPPNHYYKDRTQRTERSPSYVSKAHMLLSVSKWKRLMI
ncbi:RIN4, pathogenic type III effector avirulence factor Avr cleavage site [Parasponia andersonii]|uniref:RIN4, pathogenic type III effector avirulence factor Avr cleavage site n=1 Tax=Parasponia andersonii TaxID=3476 RepID=A0A2P5BTW5_PARAD|nr:RIN4, pathogenic type III effector avirulence factor Avr cleavage site [Parasponia andersonii]